MAVKTQVVQQTIYEYLADVPTSFKKEITAMMDAGILKGDGSDPDGNGDRINLTHEQVRTFVISYRGGAYDKALIAAGLTPAIQ